MALTGGLAVACFLLLALAVAAEAASHATAPAPAVDCQAAAVGLSDCVDFVSPGSALSRPGKKCCRQVKTAIKDPATVECLCTVFASKQLPMPVNEIRAQGLPAACGASAAFSKCHTVPGAGGAPTEAPSPSAGSPSSGGSTTAPPPKNAATRSPVTATVLVASVAAPLLAFYYL